MKKFGWLKINKKPVYCKVLVAKDGTWTTRDKSNRKIVNALAICYCVDNEITIVNLIFLKWQLSFAYWNS